MTHDEQREWLTRRLMAENELYADMEYPEETQPQKDLLRALMNVRVPAPVSDEFLRIQDEYLSEENRSAGITEAESLPSVPSDDRIILWQGDITALRADVIVNAANSQLCGCFRPLHNCVDNVIHSKSGIQLRLRCHHLMEQQGYEEPTGRARLTPAYNLPSTYVLHTVGPIVEDRLTAVHEEQLASCYRSCLEAAQEAGAKSLAFCCISTGVFRFPNRRAAEIAVRTVKEYLDRTGSPMKVVFDVWLDEDYAIYSDLLA